MTDSNYTHITLVVDRSGSMATTLADAQGGMDTFLKEQFEFPGKLTVSLWNFDNEIVQAAKMATTKPEYKIIPRGSTALLDAVGKAISATGEELAALPEDERPGIVIVAVVTDGGENASEEWTFDSVKAKTEEQTNEYGWHFIFIGQDQHSWQGQSMGMRSVHYNSATAGSTQTVYGNLNVGTTNLRSGFASSLDVDDVE